MTDQKLIRLIEDNGLNLHGDIEHFAHLVAAAIEKRIEELIRKSDPVTQAGATVVLRMLRGEK